MEKGIFEVSGSLGIAFVNASSEAEAFSKLKNAGVNVGENANALAPYADETEEEKIAFQSFIKKNNIKIID